MPCGFGIEKAVEQTTQLLQQPGWSGLPAVRHDRVFAVNANAYFARPGPRVIDGTELLAHLLHPGRCEWRGPGDAFRKIPCDAIGQAGARTKQCPECGASFTCGAQAGNETCWCDDLPPLSPVSPDRDCLCPQCLAQAIEAKGG
jgi:hypothetical protein